MSKKTATRKKSKPAAIKDLPMKSRKADAVVGGGTRRPTEPKPTESISLSYTKIQT